MNRPQQINEQLSAFLDGETSAEEAHELYVQLCRDPHLRATLDRHHHFRATLRGELHAGLDESFASRVLAGIESGGTTGGSDKLIPFRVPQRRPLMRTVFALAVAASVAAVAILSLQTLLPSANPGFPALLTNISTRDVPAQAPATEVAVGRLNGNVQWNDLSPDAAAELNGYLISHNNSAADHGLNSTMGFMRVAAQDDIDFMETDQ